MGHGKAIFDYADEEEQQPLLAQYHEDGQLFLTFFDLRIRKLITIATHEGAKSFLRQAADLIDPDTGELERIRFLERELDRYKVAHEDFCRPLMAWADLNGHLPETLGASRGSAACTHLHHLIKLVGQQMSLEAALNTQERSLFTELMCFLARYQDFDAQELAPATLQRLIAQTEDTSSLRTLTVEQGRKLVAADVKRQDLEHNLDRVRENYHALADRLENWALGWRLSCPVAEILTELINRAEQSQLRLEENIVLREHVDQAVGNYQAQRTELREAQTLLADLHQFLKGLPSQPITDTLRRYAITDTLRRYVEDRRLLATDEIPF